MNQQDIFEGKEKLVLKHLKEISDDIFFDDGLITYLRKKDVKTIKSQLCFAFIAGDTFSRFHSLFIGDVELEKNNERRFRLWLEKFVLNDNNDIFKKYKMEIKCDSFIVWKLRNSLIHFFGLPKEPRILLGQLPRGKTGKIIKMAINKFKDKNYRIVNPYYLIKALESGLLLQLLEMKVLIDKDQKKYIDGINRCYDVVMEEATQFVREGDF